MSYLRELRLDQVLRSRCFLQPERGVQKRAQPPENKTHTVMPPHDRGQHHDPTKAVHVPGQSFHPPCLPGTLAMLQHGSISVSTPYANLPFLSVYGAVAQRVH